MMGWRQLALRAAHRLIGSRAGVYYREFLDLQTASPESLRRMSEQRLNDLLAHALAQAPFYRSAVGGRGRGLEDFPIVTKLDLVQQFNDFMTPELAREFQAGVPSGYSWVAVKTGGTSGVPTTLIHDREFRDRGRASRLFSQALCGFPIGTPYYQLWGSMEDVNAMRDAFAKRVLRRLSNVHVMNAFRMDADRMRDYLARINASPIRHLMAYVDAAEQLARFAATEGITVKPLTSVMACAGTVTEAVRDIIGRVFAARVHNKYGSRDCADMACECDRGRLHWFSHQIRLEVVDDDGHELPSGEPGRLLVTLLHNRQFPLIRYEIGDRAALIPGQCPCGMPFPLIEKLEGRTIEFVKDLAGTRVTPVYIRHLIGVVHNPHNELQRFQLNQLERDRYEVLFEVAADKREAYQGQIVPLIVRDLVTVFGKGARVEARLVDRIEESKSGKFVYVRNLFRS